MALYFGRQALSLCPRCAHCYDPTVSSPAVASRTLPLLLGFLIAIGPVSVDLYLPAFPTIAGQFHNQATPGITLAAYFAGLAGGQIMQGPLSDRIGRRTPILAGLVLYTIASAGCGVAWSGESLTLWRLLAGFGASASVVIPRAMVRDIADGPAAVTLFSRLTLVMGVAPVIAPMIGSAVIALVSWRWIFGLAALYGLVAIALSVRFLPDTLPPARRSAIGVRSIMVRYVEIGTERSFLTHALAGSFAMAALFAYLSGTPGVFIQGLHWSPFAYAVMFASNAAFYIAMSQGNPLLVRRFGVRPVLSLAIAALLLGALCLSIAAWLGAGPIVLLAAIACCQVSHGCSLPDTLVGALSAHQSHAGSASALMGTMQYVAGAGAGAAVGALSDGTARPMALVMLSAAVLAAISLMFRPTGS
ncbi:MAG: Bcr/CflA family drug resistance efflux transporter [Acidiphilium sp. 21-60-14]|nr:MAG: Bcr/CflA family drug resistance efflux transporter [Acidiphilium sp. 21-60-14]OYV89385.1 MAG: Bcr/CflA family drug resistance efflux transporter [Acidiphilium sp. 37-60-79]